MYWRYVALNRHVQETTGVLYGSRKDVLLELQSKHFNVISINLDFVEAFRVAFFSRKFSSKQMAVLFKDFENMFETGLTLPHILNTLREQSFDAHIASLCAVMNEKLKKGEALSVCFNATGKFPDLVISVISAGEQSGQLPLTFRTLSEYYKSLDEMKGKILGASIYPIIIISILIFSLVYMSLNVVPHLRDILPPAALNNVVTLFMLGMANFLEYWWGIALLLPVLVFFLFLYLRFFMKEKLDIFIFKLPYFGKVLRDYEISIVFLSIWVLHRAGLVIDVVFRKIIESNKSYTSKQLESCRKFLVSGYSVSEALRQNSFFPKLIVDTIRIGEETGRYDEYFERIYRFYRDNFQTRLNILIELVQPALFIFCGLFLFLMITAFIQPIYANLGNMNAATIK